MIMNKVVTNDIKLRILTAIILLGGIFGPRIYRAILKNEIAKSGEKIPGQDFSATTVIDIPLSMDMYTAALSDSFTKNGYADEQFEVRIGFSETMGLNPLESPDNYPAVMDFDHLRSVTVFHKNWENDNDFLAKEFLFLSTIGATHPSPESIPDLNEVTCSEMPCGPTLTDNPSILRVCKIFGLDLMIYTSRFAGTLPERMEQIRKRMHCTNFPVEKPSQQAIPSEVVHPMTTEAPIPTEPCYIRGVVGSDPSIPTPMVWTNTTRPKHTLVPLPECQSTPEEESTPAPRSSYTPLPELTAIHHQIDNYECISWDEVPMENREPPVCFYGPIVYENDFIYGIGNSDTDMIAVSIPVDPALIDQGSCAAIIGSITMVPSVIPSDDWRFVNTADIRSGPEIQKWCN
jgi:hypothetical protein